MKSAYVTGATGFVGLNLVKHLSEGGWKVIALHRPSSNLEFLNRFDADLVVGDVTDYASLEVTMPEEVDVVFHLAASTNFWSPKNDIQTQINVDGTRNIVAAAIKKRAKRFIHTSSVAAYGPRDGDVLREDLTQTARGHWINYFATKAEAEQEVRDGIKQGLKACIIQPGNILGPYDIQNWSRMFKLLKENKLPGIFPGGGPWCHVDNVVQAEIRVAESSVIGETYLIGSLHASFSEVATAMASLIGVKSPKRLPKILLQALARFSYWGSLLTRKEPDVTPEIAHICSIDFKSDCSKAIKDIGYREHTLNQMLEDIYTWLLAENRL